jgi:hypothetical protein
MEPGRTAVVYPSSRNVTIETKESRSLIMNQSIPKKTFAQSITNLIAGTQKNLPNAALTLDGQSYTRSSLAALLQGLADVLAKSSAAESTWHDTLQQERTMRSQVSPVLTAYTNWLLATYGSSPAVLAEFGLTPRKARTPLDATQRAAAVAKGAATRAARHTMGSQQKKSVKGHVTGVVVTPITAPAAPVVGPAPAPTPASPAPASPVATQAPATANGH